MSVSNPVVDHIDTDLKRIFLKVGVVTYHPVTDIYTEVRNLRRLNEPLRKFKIMTTAEGNKPKGGGKYTSRYAIFNNGYRVVPQDATHALYISGEQITDDGQSGPACIDTLPLSAGANVTIHYEPPASELVRADAELQIITRSAYQGVVALDVVHGEAGTTIPIGTHAQPSNNVADAVSIASSLGIEALAVHGALTLTTGDDVSGYVLRGENAITTFLTVEPGANVTNTQIDNLILTGTMDGFAYISHCSLSNVSGIEGYVELSMLSGALGLTGTQNTYFVDCKSGCVGIGTTDLPVLDMSGVGRHVAFRNYAGPIKITNSTDPDNTICLDIASGATITLDATCTAGLVYIRGIANVINNSAMTVSMDAQLDQASVASAVGSRAVEGTYTADEVLRIVTSVLSGKVSGAGTGVETFRDIEDAKDRVRITVDNNGNRTGVVIDAT